MACPASQVPTGFRIDHKNLPAYLRQLKQEPYFQPGGKCPPRGWYRTGCWLVLALGELAEDEMKTLALAGLHRPEVIQVPKNAGLNAQGLEGCCRIRKPLFDALMNLRDLVPQYRGYIVCDAGKPVFV